MTLGKGPEFEIAMSNEGPNKGRRLGFALRRFAAMLIEEARDLSGLTYSQLDEEFGFSDGKTSRYFQRKRGPNAEEVQNLENLVARLLKRPAHIVIINNRALVNGKRARNIVGAPDRGLNLRDADQEDLVLGYEDDWPTYHHLKYSRPADGSNYLELFAWQWGVNWDRGLLSEPWTRENIGVGPDVPVEDFLEVLVENAKKERKAAVQDMERAISLRTNEMNVLSYVAGNLPEPLRHFR